MTRQKHGAPGKHGADSPHAYNRPSVEFAELTGTTRRHLHGPSTLTILPTYRCTAACRECCFESSPHLQGRIPIERILAYIDDAASSFPSLQLVCFSGGECFLLGKDLDTAIARAHSHGLMTRCVTNGYWAVTESAARSRVEKLCEAGLTELNFSTGDEHQQFVPYSRVVDGAIAAAERDMTVVIVIEGCNEARFTMREALSDARMREFMRKSSHALNLHVLNNIWMSFHMDNKVTHTSGAMSARPSSAGCSNILNNMVITPHQQLASCCGLTFEHIPEMKLGDLRQRSMKELYYSQFDDFLKLWIAIDGPEAICRFALQKDPSIVVDDAAAHICEWCVFIHHNPRIREVLANHYQEKVTDVMFRYYFRTALSVA